MAKMTRVDSIIVAPNRQRRDFDPVALEETKASIEGPAGLMHAPVVRRVSDGSLQLVAGERRLRCIADIYALGGSFCYDGEVVPDGMVPYVELGDLDEIEAFEAELDENIRRKDLTMQERAKAVSDLMELRVRKARFAGLPAPSATELAKEIYHIPDLKPKGAYGMAGTTVAKQLIIAKHLNDPDVKKATSINEAYKIIKGKEERNTNALLAATLGKTFTKKLHTLLNVDAATWCVGAKDEQFDIILTDPPYGMGADEFGDSGQGVAAAAHLYEDSYESWQQMVRWFAPESFRLARPDSHLYAFCDLDNFFEFRAVMGVAGWKVHRTPLIWHNPDGFRAPWPQHGPQRKYELILYARKGDRTINKIEGDVLQYRKDAGNVHPAQKPVALLQDLLRRSVRPGDHVFDPFGGSGSTLVACHSMKLAATVLERDAAAYGAAVTRLKGLPDQEGLFA